MKLRHILLVLFFVSCNDKSQDILSSSTAGKEDNNTQNVQEQVAHRLAKVALQNAALDPCVLPLRVEEGGHLEPGACTLPTHWPSGDNIGQMTKGVHWGMSNRMVAWGGSPEDDNIVTGDWNIDVSVGGRDTTLIMVEEDDVSILYVDYEPQKIIPAVPAKPASVTLRWPVYHPTVTSVFLGYQTLTIATDQDLKGEVNLGHSAGAEFFGYNPPAGGNNGAFILGTSQGYRITPEGETTYAIDSGYESAAASLSARKIARMYNLLKEVFPTQAPYNIFTVTAGGPDFDSFYEGTGTDCAPAFTQNEGTPAEYTRPMLCDSGPAGISHISGTVPQATEAVPAGYVPGRLVFNQGREVVGGINITATLSLTPIVASAGNPAILDVIRSNQKTHHYLRDSARRNLAGGHKKEFLKIFGYPPGAIPAFSNYGSTPPTETQHNCEDRFGVTISLKETSNPHFEHIKLVPTIIERPISKISGFSLCP